MTTTPKEGASAPSIEPAKNPCRLPPETAERRRVLPEAIHCAECAGKSARARAERRGR